MINKNPATNRAPATRLVGVIASPTALGRALRSRRPPDLFELRLDALRQSLGAVARALPRLRAPLILIAVWRHSMLRCNPKMFDESKYFDTYLEMMMGGLLAPPSGGTP